MHEIDSLKAKISQLNADAISLKLEEERKMNEMRTKISKLEKDIQDAKVREQETKLGLGQAYDERLRRVQDDYKAENEKIRAANLKEVDKLLAQVSAKEKERISAQNEKAEKLLKINDLGQEREILLNEISKLKVSKIDLGSKLAAIEEEKKTYKEEVKKEV